MEEQIRQHPVWALIPQFATLRGDKVFLETGTDTQVAWYTERIFQFVDLTAHRLRKTPITLLSVNALSQLQGIFSSAVAEIGNYIANRNVAHLVNASNLFDNQGFVFLASIPFGESEGSITELGELADGYRSQTQGILKALYDERDRLKLEMTTLQTSILQQTAQLKELSDAVATQKAEASTTVQALQTIYAAKEQEFAAKFSASTAKQIADHAELVAKLSDEADQRQKALATAGTALLTDLENQRDQAKKIVRIVGNIGVTGNYQETAAIERAAADLWRRVTFGAFIVAAACGGLALFNAHDASVPLTIARMLFSFLILAVTVYTGRESARHRTNADRAKRVELELASFGPFIESLDTAKQNELRAKLTEEYFGKDVEPHTVNPVVDPGQLIDLLKVAIGKLGK